MKTAGGGGEWIDRRYRLCQQLGSGAFGAVYLAEQMAYETPFRVVALKIFLNEVCDVFEAREILNDALVLTRLVQQCPDPETAALFLQIYDVGSYESGDDDGNPAAKGYMAMELMTRDLRKVVGHTNQAHFRVCTVNEALTYLLPVVRALAYMHAQDPQILHRDLKPENVLLKHGPRLQIKVGDFGLAVSSHKLLGQPAARGTLRYQDLEGLLFHTASAESDVFAIGMMFYELLTGRFPFRSDYLQINASDELSRKIIKDKAREALHRPIVPPSQLNVEIKSEPWLERVILDCLTTYREERIKDARELLARLENARKTPRTRTLEERYDALLERGDRMASMGPSYQEEARRCYLEAMQVGQDYCNAYIQMSELLCQEARLEEALELLIRRKKIWPCNCVHWQLSKVYDRCGRPDMAAYYDALFEPHKPCKYLRRTGSSSE